MTEIVFLLWLQCRSYRNGFVWHDLTDDDYVHPVAGREYVLKGTELLLNLKPPTMQLPLLDAAAAASSCSSGSQETTATSSSSAGWEQHHGHRKGAGEYRVYKQAEDRAADAATQTDDYSYRGRHGRRAQAEELSLSREETSPPTASTSPETLEALIKADGRVVAAVAPTRARGASSVLMQLISCGSVSVKGGLATPVMPRGAHYRPRPPRPPVAHAAATVTPNHRQKVVEDKEYFSGSLVETQRSAADACQDLAVLRRSSSYNADR